MAAITFVPDAVLDAPLTDIITNGDVVHLTGDVVETITYAQVLAASFGTYAASLGAIVDSGTGRKVVLAAASGVVVDTATNFVGADQTFSQYIIVDTTNSLVKFIGIGTNKVLSNGDTVNCPAADIINPAIVAV